MTLARLMAGVALIALMGSQALAQNKDPTKPQQQQTSTAGAQTWQAQEKSSAAGTLTDLASSPSITVSDTTAPSAPTLSFGSFTNASATGSEQ